MRQFQKKIKIDLGSKRQKKEKKIKTSLYLSPNKMRQLRIHCAEDGIRMTDYVEKAIVLQLQKDAK